MRAAFVILVLLVGGASPSPARHPRGGGSSPAAQARDPRLLAELIAAERQFWDGWQQHHPGVFRTGVRRDGFFFGANGFDSRDSVAAEMARSVDACTVRAYRLDDPRAISLKLDAAMLTYVAHQDAICGGQPVQPIMNGVSVYVRDAGRWLNVMRAEVPAPRR